MALEPTLIGLPLSAASLATLPTVCAFRFDAVLCRTSAFCVTEVTVDTVVTVETVLMLFVPDSVVRIGVIDVMPCTVMTSEEAVPAVPKAGCLAAVEAPVGSEIVPEMFVMFHVPDCAACTAKVPEFDTVSGVIEAMPWTVITSDDAVPAVPSAGCFAAVAAPVGRDTVPEMLVMFQVPDCVAATVPVTVTDPEIDTLPDTG